MVSYLVQFSVLEAAIIYYIGNGKVGGSDISVDLGVFYIFDIVLL